MPIDQGVNVDLQFLLLEVRKQARAAQGMIEKPSDTRAQKIKVREDYVDNLKNTIENKAYFNIHQEGEAQMNYFKALITISANLERIADFFYSIADQMQHVRDPDNFEEFELRRYFRVIGRALEAIYPAITDHNLDLAQKICDYEQELDDYYDESFKQIRRNLRQRYQVDDMLSLLTIVGYLERVGDSFLNIGEAILDIHVGEKMGIVEFRDLRKGLATQSIDISDDNVDFSPIMNTRSGCRVAKITAPGDVAVFYKEGSAEKISSEVSGLETWNKRYPDHTPKILWHNTRKSHSTLLLEWVDGEDLLSIIIKKRQLLEPALRLLTNELTRVWETCRKEKSKRPQFIRQLNSRKSDIESMHGNLFAPDELDDMVAIAKRIEKQMKVPFTTLIHGDFNADNILIRFDAKKIYYVDVHRSGFGDYVQDVSVFMVSNIRVPVFSPDIRVRLNDANTVVYRTASRFARKQGDTTFDARLALGLFRSLITSTRFIFDRNFSTQLYDRARLLLSELQAAEADLQKFKLKPEHFTYE